MYCEHCGCEVLFREKLYLSIDGTDMICEDCYMDTLSYDDDGYTVEEVNNFIDDFMGE